MGVYDSNDLYWTWDGDFAIGNNGDIKDCQDDLLASLRQEIAAVVKSELGEWQLDPLLGASLSDFVGEPNTRENAKAIENRIRLKLVEAQIVQREDLSIRIVPISVHQLMILINVAVIATSNNGLTIADPVQVSLLYDTMENNLFFMPPSRSEV